MSRTRFLIDYLSLKKPWLYLVFLCYFFTMAFVWAGNPLIPIDALAVHGLAWHHIPEICAFFSLGVWLGSLGYLSLESFTYLDSFALFLVAAVGLAYAHAISYSKVFPIVLTIVFVPSFLGYFSMRFHCIHKLKHAKVHTF